MKFSARILVWALVAVCPVSLGAATYYLDGSEGDDAGAGTSRGAGAWRTWARLMTGVNSAQPGDMFLARPGRYYAANGGGSDDNWRNLKGPVSGSSDAWITISVDTDYSGDVELVGS
ncbi:MAG TPA: hypothetical protein VI895_14295, partial [Bdellovibrionota bacterium]|nr:hypothetical protein [Bdellovibrionota bacterium]